jgi:tetratricopeptide (TPR) repeat protein
LRGLAALHRDEGEYEQAHNLATAAIELATGNADRRLEVGSRTTRATVDARLGRYDRAVAGHQHALRLAREVGNRYLEAEATVGLAEALAAGGRSTEALEQARAADALARANGYGLLERRTKAVLAQSTVETRA